MTARRTWYVAGRDWPAIPLDIPIGEVYAALERITDQAVETARLTLTGEREHNEHQ